MAGEIAEVGPGVAKWKAGDRVLVNPLNKKKGLMGEMLDGGMAEYCLVAAEQLVAMPDGCCNWPGPSPASSPRDKWAKRRLRRFQIIQGFYRIAQRDMKSRDKLVCF